MVSDVGVSYNFVDTTDMFDQIFKADVMPCCVYGVYKDMLCLG